MTDSITRAKADIERKTAQLAIMQSVVDAIPTDLPEPKSVFACNLWGSIASVTWFLDSVEKAVQILDAFPPTEPRFSARSGTLAFKPQSAVKRSDTCIAVEPVTVEITHGQSGYPMHTSDVSLNWFARIGDFPVHIRVQFKDSCENGSWPRSTVTKELGGRHRNEVKSITQCFVPGVLNLTPYRSVRWASGDALTPSLHTAYWEVQRPGVDCSNVRKFLDLLK